MLEETVLPQPVPSPGLLNGMAELLRALLFPAIPPRASESTIGALATGAGGAMPPLVAQELISHGVAAMNKSGMYLQRFSFMMVLKKQQLIEGVNPFVLK